MLRVLYITIFIFLSFSSKAATFIRSISNQWFYFDETVDTDFFIFQTDSTGGNLFKHAQPVPVPHDDSLFSFITKIHYNESGEAELWAERSDTSLFVIKLTDMGVEYFEKNTLSICKAIYERLEVRQDEYGNYAIWRPSENKMVVPLKKSAALRILNDPESLNSFKLEQ